MKVTQFFLNSNAIGVFCIVLFGMFIMGCNNPDSDKTACEDIIYKDSGPYREEYLPCAGEMIAKLDDMTPLLKAALQGDRKARRKGIKALKELEALIQASGGIRYLLGGWEDESLGDLNVYIINAYFHYDAFLRVTMLGSGSPAAKPEFERGQKDLEEAKDKYKYL